MRITLLRPWVSNRFLSLPLIKWSDYFLFTFPIRYFEMMIDPPLNLSEKALLPWGILMERCIDRIAKLSFPSEAIIIDIDEKIFTSFHVFIYLSASSRSIQPRHINIISTSFYFIFPTIHRALFPTPSSIIFIKFKLITLHDVSLHLIPPYVSFHLLLKFHHAKWFTFFYPQ